MANRLKKEHKKIEKDEDEDRFFVEVRNNNLEWVMKIMIRDNEECCYAGGCYTLLLTFPAEYPFKPPVVQFTPPVYHPAVDQETGKICQEIFNPWGPTRNVKWIMTEVLYNMFLTEDGEIAGEIVKQKEENYDAFKAQVVAQIAEFEA